ncbi:nucleoid-associated protein, partial [Streptococcus equi subsp. equi]|nr:nucleoid-associated protein [Streptococcus equi subsp. equi]
MLDIYIKGIVIHQFTPNDTELILSDALVAITPRIDEYFRKKLAKVFSDDAKRGQLEAIMLFLPQSVQSFWKHQ